MKEILRRLPDVLRAEELPVPEEYKDRTRLFRLRYRSGEWEVEGFLCAPAAGDGPWPALIFNRGGNREYGALRGEALCPFAARGYAVLGSQYRGNCGGTGREEFGGSDVDDVIKLIDIALSLPFARREGVYMVGRSRGGMMTYLACARDTRIRAAAIGAGLADCFIMYNRFHDGEYDMRLPRAHRRLPAGAAGGVREALRCVLAREDPPACPDLPGDGRLARHPRTGL